MMTTHGELLRCVEQICQIVSECPNVKKTKNGGLDQYGPERFEV